MLYMYQTILMQKCGYLRGVVHIDSMLMIMGLVIQKLIGYLQKNLV